MALEFVVQNAANKLVSRELWNFFQAELANDDTMCAVARCREDVPPLPTLDSAVNSFMQMPEDLIQEVMGGCTQRAVDNATFELGALVGAHGRDALLTDFELDE